MKLLTRWALVGFLACAAGSACAETRAWWRFDDAEPGTATTGTMRLANSEGVVQAAVPQSQNATNLGTDPNWMPEFADPLGGSGRLLVYDPVSGASHTNRAALHYKGTVAATVNPNSCVYVPNTDLKVASLTAECFFRAPANIGTQTMSTLLHMQRATGAATWTLQIYGGGLFVRSTIRTGTSTAVKCDYVKYEISTLKDAKWHHAAITYDADTRQMKLYLDYKCLQTWEYEENDGFDYVTGGKFLIGGNTVQSGRNFPGDIDEVRISDTALPAESFLRMKALPVDQDPDTLVRLTFDADLRLASTGLAINLNQAPNTSIGAVYKTKGTPVDDRYRPGDSDNLCETNISEGVWGANRANLGSYRSITNAWASGQWVVVDNLSDAVGSGSYTAECFFKLDGAVNPSPDDGNIGRSLVPMGCGAYRAIFDARPSYCGQFVLRTYKSTDLNQFAQLTLYDFARSRGASAVEKAAAWHHLACVCDTGKSEVRWYLDYRLVGTSRDTVPISVGSFFFGANSADGVQPFSGWLDECRVVRRALMPYEFLTSRHVEGVCRAWIDYEENMAAKPDPFGLGEGELQDWSQLSERVRQSYRHAVCDADGNVLRENQQWSYHIKGGRYTLPVLPEILLPSFTLEMFLRAAQLGKSDNILALGSSVHASCRSWSLRNGTEAGGLCFKLMTSEDGAEAVEKTVDFPAGNFADNAWRHVAVSVGPSGTDTEVKLYVDHACVKTETVAGTYVTPSASDTVAQLCFGASGCDVVMDEIRILDGVQGPESFLYPPRPNGTVILYR